MSIVASDLIFYCAANMPVDDTSTAGGAIDATMRPVFTQIAANDTTTAVSSSASDTQNATVVGRNAAGSVVSETKAMTGTTGINFSSLSTVERILSFKLATAAVGTVTFARGTAGSVGPTIATVPAGEKGVIAFFQQFASDPSTSFDRYAKVFVKNANGSLAALGMIIKENADPSGVIQFWVVGSVNDSGTVTNRLTAPGGSSFSNSNQTIPGTDLAAGSAIGVWARETAAAGAAALRSTWTLEADCQST